MPSHSFDRRGFLRLAGGALLLSKAGGVLAGAEESPTTPDLYVQVPQIEGEWNRVRLFFSVSCPFSKSWHEGMLKWGSSLPKQIQFMPTPVVTLADDESYVAARSFYAVSMASPNRVATYMAKCYEGVQERRLDPTDVRTYIMAASNAGVDMRRFMEEANSVTVHNLSVLAAKMTQRYKVRQTPAFGISGKYLTSPEGVAGNAGLFYQLMNALVSKTVIEGSG